MNDELMTLVDARGRAAGSALHRASATRSWTASAPKRPVVWVRPALLMAAVVAVIAGLVWVTGRPAEPADQRDPAGLRYLIGEVPTGWGAPVAQDATARPIADSSNVRLSLFGTPGDPTAPVLQIAWQDPSKESDITLGGLSGVAGYDNLREIAARGDVAACGDRGVSLQCALSTSNGLLQSASVGLSDAAVGRMLSAVEFVEGDTSIEPDDLPEGMTLISRGALGAQAPVLWTPMNAPGASRVSYAANIGDGTLVLAIGWADQNDLAGAATWGDMKRVDLVGRPAFMGVSPWLGANGLFWIVGERAFALVTLDTSLDLLAVAASVRPATSDEWSEIVVDTQSVTEETTPADGTTLAVPETTVLAESPDTVSPVSEPIAPEFRDVVVTQTVRTISEFDASYSSELPDGVFGEVQIAVVARTVLVRDEGGMGGSFSWELDGSIFTSANPWSSTGDGVDGVIAATTDPAATQLRVTRDNGDRYLLDLVSVRNHPELKVGVVMLPTGTFVTFDVVDADGNLLLSYENP